MDWVEGELKKEEARSPQRTQSQPPAALSNWYGGFKAHLEQDVSEYNRDRGGAAEVAVADHEAVVLNRVAAVRGAFRVDLDLQQVRSEYTALRPDVAVPEGEIFTLRFEDGRLAIFSADQEITEEALREELLKPVLFPEEPS